MRRVKPALALTIVVLLSAAVGCTSDASSDTTVVGIVTQVSGDLGSVESFIVTDPQGQSHQFTPAPGLLFDGGPIDHLREHIVTGDPVEVRYERSDGGALIAVEVTDRG
jgi:hypothetical protein